MCLVKVFFKLCGTVAEVSKTHSILRKLWIRNRLIVGADMCVRCLIMMEGLISLCIETARAFTGRVTRSFVNEKIVFCIGYAVLLKGVSLSPSESVEPLAALGAWSVSLLSCWGFLCPGLLTGIAL